MKGSDAFPTSPTLKILVLYNHVFFLPASGSHPSYPSTHHIINPINQLPPAFFTTEKISSSMYIYNVSTVCYNRRERGRHLHFFRFCEVRSVLCAFSSSWIVYARDAERMRREPGRKGRAEGLVGIYEKIDLANGKKKSHVCTLGPNPMQ